MNKTDQKLLGQTFFWGSLVGGLLLWPLFFVSIAGLRNTVFDINNSIVHAHVYQGVVFAIFFILLVSLISGGLIIQKTHRRFWIFHAFAVLILLGNFLAAFFNFWIVGCMGYGEGCI